MASDATKQTINQSLIDLKAEVADRTKSVITGVKIPELEDTRIISNTDQLIIETGDGTKRTTMRAFGDFVGTGLATPKEVQDARGNYPQLGDRLDAMDGKIGTNEQNIQNNSQEIAELKAKHEADMREVINARTDNKNPIATHNNLKERLDSDYDYLNSEVEKINSHLSELDNERQYISVLNFGAKGDGVTDDTASFQSCLDYANEHGLGVLIPSKSFYIGQPLVLKEGGTYYIKGINTSMNDGSVTKSASVIIPNTILFKGELIDNNTTVYINLVDLRIMPVRDGDYTKDGTYIFYNLNLYGLYLNRVTVRCVDVFSQGYISKASVINSCRISFIKSAFMRGNQYNGAFMADSQITNSYITGAYPVTLFVGTCVNSTVSNCFLDYFKYVHDCDGRMSNHFNFKDNTMGIFYRWFEGNICRGNINIEGNKIDHISNTALIQASNTNFVNIDNDMRTGTAGAFVQCAFMENVNEYSTDKCKIHANRFTESDNIFTRSNGYMQVSIKDNTYSYINGSTYDLSFRDTTNGVNKFGEFYCDALDNQVVTQLPTIRNGNNVYVFEGQRCIMNGIEYVVKNDKWVATSYLNYYQTNEIVVGKYLGKDLYRKVITGRETVENTGFKNINIPEAENLFFISDMSYWGDQKIQFNNIPKTTVWENSVGCMVWNEGATKRLMLYNNGVTAPLTFDYSITIEYTKL